MLRRLLSLIALCALLACSNVVAMPGSAKPAARGDSGVWYEIFVRSWYDTNGDGIGDLNGVTAKLDYLKSLGVSGIWLMPINPSPSYHGYDITDYEAINPQYGNMSDLRHLLDEAHRRGIRVIMDLVINHTSSQHPWFIAAANPRDPHHDWYAWATAKTDLDAVSATGGSAWHAAADGTHYLGIFTGDMPDLDYDTPAVRKAMIGIGQFWLKQGVDGFRLDAAQHIYLDFKSEEDSASVLGKNLAWWSQFRRGMQAVKPSAYLVGEVVQPDAAHLAPWFGSLDSVFDFPLAKRLIDSANEEQAGDLANWLATTDAAYRKVAGHSGVDAPFLSNHDQQRVMSQLDGNLAHMRMAAALLLTLPGQPFVYYGEELGMRGSKPDPDLREPMRWYRAADGKGETRWKTFSAGDGPNVSVQAEQDKPDSLLHDYTTLIHWRSELPVLRDGRVSAWPQTHRWLAAWQLDDASQHVLVLHNLSGKPQQLSLSGNSVHTVLCQSNPHISLKHRQLHLPPYSSAILD
jgi:alpha-amylase